MKSSICRSGPTWLSEMNASTRRPETLDLGNEAVLHGVLEGAAGGLDVDVALQLDEGLLDVRVHHAHDAGENVVVEQLGGRSPARGGNSARAARSLRR